MTRNRKMMALGLGLAMGAMGFSATSGAALINRGGGLIYDDDTNLTWMQEAGLNGGLQVNQAQAQASVDALNYFDSVRSVYWNDWRLPSVGANPADFSVPADNDMQVLWQHLGSTSEPVEAGNAGDFNVTTFGGYWNHDTGLSYAVWAVRNGDVATVPVPAAVWLFGSAITSMGIFGSRKGKTGVMA